MPYRWHTLTPEQRADELQLRQRMGLPWHGPPHYAREGFRRYLITAACYRHQPNIGRDAQRMTAFMVSWIRMAEEQGSVRAYCILPNHYHVLVETEDILHLLERIGQLHGRTSFAWNGEDGTRGRQVFHRAAETRIKNDRHFCAALNYVHHNPVRHGYVGKWTDWPWSSAVDHLKNLGREEVERMWREYDISTFGDGWDDPEL